MPRFVKQFMGVLVNERSQMHKKINILVLYSCAKDGQFISIIVHHQIASNRRKGTLFEGSHFVRGLLS